MKKISVNILTIFPDPVLAYLEAGIMNRAKEKGIADYNVVDLRKFSDNKYGSVDDTPYGGGPGMVLMAPVVINALESLENPGIRILLSPTGRLFDQELAEEFAGKDITLICGRYTGIDNRVKKYTDLEISAGNFILSGGELAALTVAEASMRLVPGVLGAEESLDEDRGYPVFTRPRDFRGIKVPDVLLSGNHKEIEKYRVRESKYGKDNRKTNKK